MLLVSEPGHDAWDLGDVEASGNSQWPRLTAWLSSLWPVRSNGRTPSHATWGSDPRGLVCRHGDLKGMH